MPGPDAIAAAIANEFTDLSDEECDEFAGLLRSRIAARLRHRDDWFLQELARLRQEAGLTVPAIAQRLDWSTSKLFRVYAGDRVPSKTDLNALLTTCNAPADLVVALHEEAAKRRHAKRVQRRRGD